MNLRLRMASVTVMCALMFAASSAVADVTNGDFESGPDITPSQAVMAVSPGSTALTGWTVSGNAVKIVTTNYWESHSGGRSLALSNTAPGTISQSFATTSGAIYRLTFWMSGEPFSTPTIKHLHIQAGATQQDYTFDITPAWHWDMAWAQHTLDFVAPGPSTTISFTSMDAGSWGPALDALSVTFVSLDVGAPGPAALTLAPLAPNPVREAGLVGFVLPDARPVRLSVVDLQGREIAVLADGSPGPGPHELSFSTRAVGGRAGVYFLVLSAGDRTVVRRFAVIE